MIHMCNDLIRAYDEFSPCPSDPREMDAWMDDVHAFFLDSFPPEEIEAITQSSHMRLLETILRTFIRMGTLSEWEALTVAARLEHVGRLMSSNQVPQRTPEWYSQSKMLLTASEFSTILGTPHAVSMLALQKVAPVSENLRSSTTACCTPEMGPFDWGIRFEPVVKQVMNQMGRAKIVDVGRIVHPENTRLAASPDGIITEADDERRIGRLVEIKCPVRRVIDGTIPNEYWCQMQIQMEVTSIDECEYVEMSFESGYKDHAYTIDGSVCPSDLYDAENNRPKYSGCVWLYQEPDTLELKYAYTAEEKANMEECGWFLHEEIPWHVKKIFRTVVLRDRVWYKSTLEKQAHFWTRVEDARQGRIDPPKKRPEKLVVQVCKIVG